jgi:hypothetical protein
MLTEPLETSATEGTVFSTRLFDAGQFHAGFGITVQPDEETIGMCVQTKMHTGRLPFRHSHAATLYGDALRNDLPSNHEQEQFLQLLLEHLTKDTDGMEHSKGGQNTARKRKPRRR